MKRKASEAPKKSLYSIDPLLKRKMRFIAAVDENIGDQTKLVNLALSGFIEKWEKKNGPIPLK